MVMQQQVPCKYILVKRFNELLLEPATTTTMEAETVPTTTPLQDLPPPQPLPCYFMSDLSDKETKIALFEKCTMTKSPLLDDIKGYRFSLS